MAYLPEASPTNLLGLIHLQSTLPLSQSAPPPPFPILHTSWTKPVLQHLPGMAHSAIMGQHTALGQPSQIPKLHESALQDDTSGSTSPVSQPKCQIGLHCKLVSRALYCAALTAKQQTNTQISLPSKYYYHSLRKVPVSRWQKRDTSEQSQWNPIEMIHIMGKDYL